VFSYFRSRRVKLDAFLAHGLDGAPSGVEQDDDEVEIKVVQAQDGAALGRVQVDDALGTCSVSSSATFLSSNTNWHAPYWSRRLVEGCLAVVVGCAAAAVADSGVNAPVGAIRVLRGHFPRILSSIQA
jgi:hypothetical protein